MQGLKNSPDKISCRLLTADDAEMMIAFLLPHKREAYFIPSNASRGGIVFEGQPFQADYFGAFENGALKAVLSHGWMGSVQIFSEDPIYIVHVAQTFIEYRAKHPRDVINVLGVSEHVETLMEALQLTEDADEAPAQEGLYSLDLNHIKLPAIMHKEGISVRLANEADEALLTQWRHDFFVEATGSAAGDATYQRAHSEITLRIAEKDLYILEAHNEPVSFCGTSGFIEGMKIVNTVWTPTAHRGLGYARAVVAGALLNERNQGCQEGLLFTGNPQAARAYLAIGFERIGSWKIAYLKDFDARQILDEIKKAPQ
jgi:predicted GNAT family acetyltransferase